VYPTSSRAPFSTIKNIFDLQVSVEKFIKNEYFVETIYILHFIRHLFVIRVVSAKQSNNIDQVSTILKEYLTVFYKRCVITRR